MCGRFVSASAPAAIAEYFGATFAGETLGENFNVAPTADIYGVVAGPDGQPRLEVFHWGLIPVWAKERKIGQRMINARAETLAEKPAFKGDFKKHRALIPMDGFYEWQAGAPGGPADQGGEAGQAADVHQPARRRTAGGGRAVVGLAGSSRRWRRLAALGHGHHDRGQRARWRRSTTGCR